MLDIFFTALDGLYHDIGDKIKSWAKWVFLIGALAAVIGAIVIMATGEDASAIVIGVLVLVGGPIVAWVSSWLLYGFGDIIDSLNVIAYNTYRDESSESVPENEHAEDAPAFASKQLQRFAKYQ